MTAEVTAVIPTQARPDRIDLLRAAVGSVLEQTMLPRELVIVADSVTAAEVEYLLAETIAGAVIPVRIVANDGRGGAAARNTGVRAASGTEWIAYLDDDDLWLPHKTEMQLARLAESAGRFRIASGAVIAIASSYETIWPREPLPARQHLSEYLFCRRGWTQGDGYLQTSTLMAASELLNSIRFDEDLTIHQDWDWLLRCVRQGVDIVHVDKPVAVWRQRHTGESVSRSASWHDSFEWAKKRRDLFSPRAYSAFLLTVPAGMAAKQHSFLGLLRLWAESCRRGRPSAKYLAVSLGHFLVPRLVLQLLRKSEDQRYQAAAPVRDGEGR